VVRYKGKTSQQRIGKETSAAESRRKKNGPDHFLTDSAEWEGGGIPKKVHSVKIRTRRKQQRFTCLKKKGRNVFQSILAGTTGGQTKKAGTGKFSNHCLGVCVVKGLQIGEGLAGKTRRKKRSKKAGCYSVTNLVKGLKKTNSDLTEVDYQYHIGRRQGELKPTWDKPLNWGKTGYPSATD